MTDGKTLCNLSYKFSLQPDPLKFKYPYINSWQCIALILLIVAGCQKKEAKPENTLFVLLPADSSGIDFINRITSDEITNILTYEYLYNGGGVGIGDFNNDGFQDVFLVGSQVPSKLYINKSDPAKHNGFHFEDVTETAGITIHEGWAFGVSVVDVNQDGLQDIYVSMGGLTTTDRHPNKLFIHQGFDKPGHPYFKDLASDYGLADSGQSIQAVFFDYDRDGDLDMYQLMGGGFEKSPNNPSPIVKDGSAKNTDRLYRNDYDQNSGHPVFTNISRQAGILEEGYGLGVSLVDINEDGWLDLYVTNDYLSNDLLYVNNQNGTFSEKVSEYFKHTSHFAMGNDVGDINNDGLVDLVAMDMLPEDHFRRKLMFGATQYNKFYYAVNHGYTYQYMRNTLQLNNGNGSFSEIGQLAGIYKTDWSWAVLLADFDNDEHQDLYITNGFGKDITDLDFVKFRSSITSDIKDERLRRKILLDSLAKRPGIKSADYAYRNNGNLSFTNVTHEWGFDTPNYSNGVAYADFDNDGDLDLVVSNIDDVAQVYRNKRRDNNPLDANYLRVKLIGADQNKSGIGSKVIIRYNGKLQSKLKSVVRGFESTVEDILHFGLGRVQQIDTLEVRWPDGKTSFITTVNANQLIEIDYKTGISIPGKKNITTLFFEACDFNLIPYHHKENPFIDFNHEPLLPRKLSQEGPGIAVGDVNNDGLEDLFIGGALLREGRFFLQKKNGTFESREMNKADIESEDMGCLFFDADNDNDLDLYVVSGGNEYNPNHRHYQDWLYFNDGKGNFAKDETALPKILVSGSCVVAADYDHDGDLDLFVGGRVLPTSYPQPPRSYILSNNGKGKFEDITQGIAPELQRPGMVTSALWTDFDNDSWMDLIVAGEYMPITFFRNDNGKRLLRNTDSGLANSEGWWNSLTAGDFDKDGDVDYIAGNFGLNSPYRASITEPMNVTFKDFDNNGALEAITSYYEEGVNYPAPSMDVLTSQLPLLKRKILYYRAYAKASTDRLLEIAGKENTQVLECKTLQSGYIENLGNGKFKYQPLPVVMQTAPVYGVLAEDVNLDGNLDFIAVGNSYAPEVVMGRCDAFIGLVMMGDGKGNFDALPVTQSGFFVNGDAKGIAQLNAADGTLLTLVTQNNDSLKVFRSKNVGKLKHVMPHKMEVTAILTYKNGESSRAEIGYGTSYLSQSSRSIIITPQVKEVQLLDVKGKPTRKFNYK